MAVLNFQVVPISQVVLRTGFTVLRCSVLAVYSCIILRYSVILYFDFHRHLTRHRHLAGTPADREQAEELIEFWNDAGLDRTELYPYDVLLSYPSEENPNHLVILNQQKEALFTSQLYEKILRPEQNQSDVVPPFNAYSASGQPKVRIQKTFCEMTFSILDNVEPYMPILHVSHR